VGARISTIPPFRSILGESAEVPTVILHPLRYSDGGSAELILGDTF
jgi:hypothetical protein